MLCGVVMCVGGVCISVLSGVCISVCCVVL